MPFLPMPDVPALDANNSLDADALDEMLDTLICYPGIVEGDTLDIDLRGCAADGSPSDHLQVALVVDELDDQGCYHCLIPAGRFSGLKGGWVFYAYTAHTRVGTPGETYEASLRRFFYVNRELPAQGGLPVAQLLESHDLTVVVDDLGGQDAHLVLLPYQAMSEGDQFTCSWSLVFPDSDIELQKGTIGHTVGPDDINRAVSLPFPHSILVTGSGLALKVSYRIDYVGNTRFSDSPMQTLLIVNSDPGLPGLLPPPRVRDVPPGADGTVIIDPDAYPEGITLEFAPYAGMSDRDGVVLLLQYASGTSEALGMRLDLTSVDSQFFAFSLDGQWVRDHRGDKVVLSYQCARGGYDGRSQDLSIDIKTQLKLPTPSVEDAVPGDDGGEYDGSIDGWNSLNFGSAILIPDLLDLPVGAELSAHWRGFTEAGSQSFSLASDQKRCAVPANLILPNLDRVVEVSCSVSLGGEHLGSSDAYRLHVVEDIVKDRLPGIQCQPVDNGTVSLAKVPDEGLELSVDYWKGMAAGQQVTLEVHGLVGGASKTFYPRCKVAVSDEEEVAERIVAHFERAQLSELALNQIFQVQGSVSFDEGASFKPFKALSLTLMS
ncbi:hypothetical protein K4A76_16890 [Pseudomonas sp. NEEL19]|uniref:hypothetical protein n=1 Tax=Pseudomonas sp. NEEL19 TaxID=2867409 RepID=UPI0023688F7B|nr:hypothetical protein [Pseudomonas sp. NEEL19]WDM58126.1 hypothetical protein K4A76_16890 [Pseudomonas sp. NEEL19]